MKGEIERLEKELRENEDLRRKYMEALESIGKNGEAESPSEMQVKAAKAIGFDISMSELEKSIAEKEKLSNDALKMMVGNDALEKVAGGAPFEDACFSDYSCYTVYHHDAPNEPGHACFMSYECIQVNENNIMPQPNQQCLPTQRYIWWSCVAQANFSDY